MTKFEVDSKLIGRIILNNGDAAYLSSKVSQDKQTKYISYKDKSNNSHLGVTSKSWQDAYNQMVFNLKEGGHIN